VSLDVDGISAYYGRIQALWDVSINVAKGEIVALIGANGAGKSTLLRAIMGLVKPQQGSISFDGKSIIRKRTHQRVRRGMSYVPEGRRLFPLLTVEDNLRLGAPRRCSDLSARMEKTYELFPILRERRKQISSTLSGGEQQMVAIGRAIMASPKLMLLDELSFGLAPIVFEKVLNAISSIHELGISILLAEQNAERALEVSQRCYVMENGRIVSSGESKKLIGDSSIRAAYLGEK
jgi:branched-chain amino acid transport system ATP-binding protein